MGSLLSSLPFLEQKQLGNTHLAGSHSRAAGALAGLQFVSSLPFGQSGEPSQIYCVGMQV